MDKIATYQKAILAILEEYASYIPIGIQEPRNQVIADASSHHYLLLRTGWDGERFLHNVIMHFEIRNEKVWVLANGTELEVGVELMQRGVPAQDIVPGFQPKQHRAYSGYAIE